MDLPAYYSPQGEESAKPKVCAYPEPAPKAPRPPLCLCGPLLQARPTEATSMPDKQPSCLLGVWMALDMGLGVHMREPETLSVG